MVPLMIHVRMPGASANSFVSRSGSRFCLGTTYGNGMLRMRRQRACVPPPLVSGILLVRMTKVCVGVKVKKSLPMNLAVRLSPPVSSLVFASAMCFPSSSSVMMARRMPWSAAMSAGCRLVWVRISAGDVMV